MLMWFIVIVFRTCSVVDIVYKRGSLQSACMQSCCLISCIVLSAYMMLHGCIVVQIVSIAGEYFSTSFVYLKYDIDVFYLFCLIRCYFMDPCVLIF